MINLDFLNVLSETLVDVCIKNKISGLACHYPVTFGRIGKVEDAVLLVSKDYFLAAGRSAAAQVNYTLDENAFWEGVNQGKGRSWLEILINGKMRQLHGLKYDLVFSKQDEALVFNFRKSAALLTQIPQSYYPPIMDPLFTGLFEVTQGTYAITCSTDPEPILASWHFASCVGFVAFNISHHIGVLAHIDEYALDTESPGIYGSLFQDIEKVVNGLHAPETIEFEYMFFGGCTDCVTGQSYTASTHIHKCLQRASGTSVVFTFKGAYGNAIADKIFRKDGSWTASMRLQRSAAIDTRKNSLKEALMSYEADLNPKSSLQVRMQATAEENQLNAQRFEQDRNENPQLTCTKIVEFRL